MVVEGTEMQYGISRAESRGPEYLVRYKKWERKGSEQQFCASAQSAGWIVRCQQVNSRGLYLGRHDMLKLVFTCLQVKVEALGAHGEAWWCGGLGAEDGKGDSESGAESTERLPRKRVLVRRAEASSEDPSDARGLSVGTQLAEGDAWDPGEASAERGGKQKCGRQSQGRAALLFLNYFIFKKLQYICCVVVYKLQDVNIVVHNFFNILLHL